MTSPLQRTAAPTAALGSGGIGKGGTGAPSEGRADPDGIHWTRGTPPLDAHIYASGDFPTHSDMVAESVARKTDDSGRGTGTGRRASGFRVPASDTGGTLVFVTGGGNTETWALAPGEGDSIEIVSIASWSGTSIRVYW